MVLHRHRWVQLLAGAALALQLLIASGLAMAAPAAPCAASPAHSIHGGHGSSCDTPERGTTGHANGACKVACAAVSASAPVGSPELTLDAPRDAAATAASPLQDQVLPDALLRPPAIAALPAR